MDSLRVAPLNRLFLDDVFDLGLGHLVDLSGRLLSILACFDRPLLSRVVLSADLGSGNVTARLSLRGLAELDRVVGGRVHPDLAARVKHELLVLQALIVVDDQVLVCALEKSLLGVHVRVEGLLVSIVRPLLRKLVVARLLILLLGQVRGRLLHVDVEDTGILRSVLVLLGSLKHEGLAVLLFGGVGDLEAGHRFHVSARLVSRLFHGLFFALLGGLNSLLSLLDDRLLVIDNLLLSDDFLFLLHQFVHVFFDRFSVSIARRDV